MVDNTFTMVDLFAGAGGLSEGLSEAGFHSLFASEIMSVYAETYKKIIPPLKLMNSTVIEVILNSVLCPKDASEIDYGHFIKKRTAMLSDYANHLING